MFISVSNNLPTTSYVKMIDIWLLSSLMLPFVQVILHTYMDSLRYDYDRDHHGSKLKIDNTYVGNLSLTTFDFFLHFFSSGNDLVSKNKKNEVEAKKAWYLISQTSNEKRLKFCKKLATVYVPLGFLLFLISWWAMGMKNYYYPNID